MQDKCRSYRRAWCEDRKLNTIMMMILTILLCPFRHRLFPAYVCCWHGGNIVLVQEGNQVCDYRPCTCTIVHNVAPCRVTVHIHVSSDNFSSGFRPLVDKSQVHGTVCYCMHALMYDHVLFIYIIYNVSLICLHTHVFLEILPAVPCV